MQLRTLFLAALGTLWLGALPALAAPSDQEKFEKKLARFAQPIDALNISKPRGLCTCGPDDPISLVGQTGVLAYAVQGGMGASALVVTCEVAAFDVAGAFVATQTCENWTLLSR